MALGAELPPTGNETIDSLRTLQLLADRIDNVELKKEYLREAVAEVPCDDLFDQIFAVESATVLGTLLTADRPRRFLFNEGMEFIGRAAAFNYFYNPNEFADFVTISFAEPVVIRPEAVAADFELFTFQVPVLAIDSLEEAY